MAPESSSLDVRINRFLRLARRTDETWQGAVVTLPLFSEPTPGAEPVRERVAIWINTATDDVMVRDLSDQEGDLAA